MSRFTTDPKLLGETVAAMEAFRRRNGRYPFGRELADLLDLAVVTAYSRMRSAAAAELVSWMSQRGRGPRKLRHGARVPQRQLTVPQVREIRARWADGERQVELAAEFGVTEANISYIVNRRTWKHVA
jgi:hypothetical protein